jgi:hypothetical protein
MYWTPNLVELLSGVSVENPERRRAWFRELAKAAPFWTRQQEAYSRLWGDQTTELRPSTAWRVMSQRLEDEAPSLSSPVGVARLELEFIQRLALDGSNFETLIAEQELENGLAVQAASNDIVAWLTRGAPKRDLPAVLRKVLGPRRPGRQPALSGAAIRILVRDAESWLSIVRSHSLAGRVRGDLHLLIPFLDSFEFDHVLSAEREDEKWQITAVRLLQRRIAYCCGRPSCPTLTTMMKSAFGPKAAVWFGKLRPLPKPLLVPPRDTPSGSK